MSLEQEGYQFFNDDGSQASATSKAGQDGGISLTLDTPVRLRMLVNVQGTAAPTSRYRLEYKEASATDYSPVSTSGGAIILALSSNISAGGEATTARLTPPSGKSAGGSFTTGRIWDDENGNDTVVMSNDQYSELEWCIKANSSVASIGQVYSFRVARQAIQATGSPVFDAIATSNGLPFPLAWTHTPVGTPTGVAVAIYCQGAVSIVSGVTYGGVPMTLAGIQTSVQIWGLASPPGGPQTVSVSGTASDYPVYGHSVTVAGGNTSTVFSGFAGATGSTVPTAVTIASATGQLVFDIVAYDNGNGAGQSADVSQTERSNQGPGAANLLVATSTKAGASNVTMAWTIGYSTPSWQQAAVSFQ